MKNLDENLIAIVIDKNNKRVTREIYIIACLLLPIIGIGLYPRLVTESYLASINNLVDRNLDAVRSTVKTNIFAANKENRVFKAPTI